MTAHDRFFRTFMLALLAPLGVFVGHALTYTVTVPDPARRAALLAQTGHGWWALALPLGAALAVAAVLLVAVRRVSGSYRDVARTCALDADRCVWLAPRLAGCQLGLFLLVETLERLAVGHGLHGLLDHGILHHGAGTQVVVAFAVAGLMACLALVVERLVGTVLRPWLPAAHGDSAPPPALPGVRLSIRPVSPLGARAPPWGLLPA